MFDHLWRLVMGKHRCSTPVLDATGKTLGDLIAENQAARSAALGNIAKNRDLSYKQLKVAEEAIELTHRSKIR